MNGWKGAVQPRGGAQFLEGQIRLLIQQRPQLVMVAGNDAGLAAGAVMLRPHVTEAATLLQELLDHAEGNTEALGHRFARALLLVVGGQNAFAQIQRKCLHTPRVPEPRMNGYSFI